MNEHGFEPGPPRPLPDLSTWEGRMAAQTAQRRLVAEVEEELREEADQADDRTEYEGPA